MHFLCKPHYRSDVLSSPHSTSQPADLLFGTCSCKGSVVWFAICWSISWADAKVLWWGGRENIYIHDILIEFFFFLSCYRAQRGIVWNAYCRVFQRGLHFSSAHFPQGGRWASVLNTLFPNTAKHPSECCYQAIHQCFPLTPHMHTPRVESRGSLETGPHLHRSKWPKQGGRQNLLHGPPCPSWILGSGRLHKHATVTSTVYL